MNIASNHQVERLNVKLLEQEIKDEIVEEGEQQIISKASDVLEFGKAPITAVQLMIRFIRSQSEN